MNNSKDNRAIAFARISSRRQKDNTSHETQEYETRLYAEAAGLNIVRIFTLIESAKDSTGRTKYIEAMRWALAQGIPHVIFFSHDRETRNLTDNEANEKLAKTGVMTLHYVKDRKAIDENSPDSEFLLRDVNAAVNKNLSRVIRTKVIDAMMTKARNGWLPTNHAPLGYKHERQGKGTVIVVDPDRQKVRQVRREFELRAFNHLSLREIRRQILGEGYVSPEKAASYHISSIDKRLKSPFYRGSFFFRGVEYQGKHELIIPPAMIAAVDAKSGARGKNRAVSGVFGGGWLKCAECACHVVHDPKTKHLKVTGETRYFSYYRCSNGRGAHEKRVHVREESLWLQFGVALDSLALEEELAVRIAEALNEAHSRGKDARRREAEGHAARLLALEKREDELYQDFRREILDEPTYRRHVEKVREDRRAVTRAMHEANDAIDDAVLETAQSTIELAKMARTLWSTRNAEEKRTFLDLILSNPRLSGRKVQYDLLKPFEALRGMREGGEMRRLADVFLTACAQMAA